MVAAAVVVVGGGVAGVVNEAREPSAHWLALFPEIEASQQPNGVAVEALRSRRRAPVRARLGSASGAVRADTLTFHLQCPRRMPMAKATMKEELAP